MNEFLTYRLAQAIQDYAWKRAKEYGIDESVATALATDIGKRIVSNPY